MSFRNTTQGQALLPLAFALIIASGVGCQGEYSPPQGETTGLAPTQLGQVLDLDVSLPNLRFPGRQQPGLQMVLKLELDTLVGSSGDAQVIYESARQAGESFPVTDLSSGRTTVTVSGTSWRSGRIGPIEVAGTAFELALDGQTANGGWEFSGVARESQSGTDGSFGGWRRHRFLVAGTDFLAAGKLTLIEWVRDSEVSTTEIDTLISSDPALRLTADELFVINRFSFDNIIRLDSESDYAATWQSGVDAGANPRDVVLARPDTIYVSRYEPPFNDLIILDSRSGGRRGVIELGSLAENADGTPRADRMRRVGSEVFVALQDIDRSFVEYAEGKLAVIDAERDELVDSIRLVGKNPGAIDLVQTDDGPRLFVAMAGIFPGFQPRDLSGGVAVVDPEARVFERWALDDDDIDANVSAMAMVGEDRGYVVAIDEFFGSHVLSFDPSGNAAPAEIFASANFISEIEISGDGVLAIPDPDFATPRVCLYRVDTTPEVELPCVPLSVPPFSVEALD